MCTRMTLKADTTDARAMIAVICMTVRSWAQLRRVAFEAEFDRLVEENRLVTVHVGGPGLLEVDASPDLLALMRRWNIGGVMA